MKRLKFWSKKKRKRKAYHPLPYYPPPPPPPSRPAPAPPPPLLPPIIHHWCSSCSRAEPSAPPLPPSWYAPDEGGDALLAAEPAEPAAPEFDVSYQQYLVENPVYGIPVSTQIAEPKTERSGGLFGCVLNFGMHFVRCFFPCYSIKEVQ